MSSHMLLPSKASLWLNSNKGTKCDIEICEFILQVIDDPVLRQAIEKQMDRIEHVHRFTRAVSVGNPREFLQAEKEDQEMAEACKRLIKNCIISWNYPYRRRSWKRSWIPKIGRASCRERV